MAFSQWHSPTPESLRLVLNWANFHDFSPNQSHFTARIDVGWLWHVTEGEIEIQFQENGSALHIEAGMWLWHPPCQERWLHAKRRGARWETVGLSALVGVRDLFSPPAPRLWQSQNDARGANLMRLVCETNSQSPLEQDGLARALCAWVWKENPDVLPAPTPPFVRACLQKIEAQPDISVAELAKFAHFSPAQFRRLWEAEFGVSPRDFLMNRRLELARLAIESNSDSLTHIAQESGFASAAQLSRAFKVHLGQSPLDWKRTLREKG